MRFTLVTLVTIGAAFAQTAAPPAAKKTWAIPRTPDGQPNIEGMYTRGGVRGLEAEPPVSPIDPADKNPLSVSNRGDGLGPYPRIFGEGGQVLRAGQQALEPVQEITQVNFAGRQ